MDSSTPTPASHPPISPSPILAEIHHFFDLLYGTADVGYLVLSKPDPNRLKSNGQPMLASAWCDLATVSLGEVAELACKESEHSNLWHGCALRRPDYPTPTSAHRGGNADAWAFPGLWLDLDVATGKHAATTLPQNDGEALAFLGTFAMQPSLILHSGGGLYGWWLFKEMFLCTTDTERQAMTDLLHRFNLTIDTMAKQRGWTFDVGDLARVLRPSGALNHKYTPPRPVQLIHESTTRYDPNDFDQWLLPLPVRPPKATSQGATASAKPDLVTVAEAYGVVLEDKSATELAGSNPAHGSSTGDNLNINPLTQLWHCWRCGSGGDVLSFIAMAEGLLDCKDCISGALNGALFPQVVTIANHKHGGTIPIGGLASNSTGGGIVDDSIPLSDVYNAARLSIAHGIDVRFCHPWNSWLTWLGTHWHRDDSGEAMRRARNTVKHIIQDARAWAQRVASAMEQAALVGDKAAVYALKAEQKQANQLFAHGANSLADARLKAMLSQAQSWDKIPVAPEALDADRWLLNCVNGTLDLRTGTLRPHQREDYLTCVLPVAYDPTALCPVWDAFLWRIMGGSGAWSPASAMVEARQAADDHARPLIAFLQRAVGWALTGDTSEECFFILYGTGANGKSKFLGALLDLLGVYGLNTQAETFTEQPRNAGGAGATPDVARLRASRLVTVIESAEDKRLNEKLISQVTGRDRVTARFLYQEAFEFTPQFKLFYACNHLPKITSQNIAMWRRIHQIPFAVTIPEQERDLHLDDKLRAELPGILAWAVRGCLEWQRVKLAPPHAVRQATEAYRQEEDLVQRFLDDACYIPKTNQQQIATQSSQLFVGFQNWCKINNEFPLSQKAFTTRLENLGYQKNKNSVGVMIWQNIGLHNSFTTP